MVADLHLTSQVLDDLISTFSGFSGQLATACADIRNGDAALTGSDPLAGQVHGFADSWNYGLTQLGQHGTECVRLLRQVGRHSTILIMNWRAGFPVLTDMADINPNLGFEPCLGDLTGYQALAAYATRSATILTSALRTLSAAGSEQWRGQAADAFRAHVHADVLPLASKAAASVGRAATALHGWALTLAALQGEA
jgi:hypothetical protein